MVIRFPVCGTRAGRHAELLLLDRLLHAEARRGKTERRRVFLFFYGVHEIASPAVRQLLRIGALDLAAAERTGDRPAGPAGILSLMRTV